MFDIVHSILNISLTHFLVLGAILFCIGIFGVIVSKNVIKILMCVELMLNAVNINFVTFSRFSDLSELQGHIFTIFVMAIAAAELVIGLAILISLYKNKPTVEADKYDRLRG